jgi:hypothetical protein
VRHHRQGYFVINYTGHPESFNEIVEAETLRPCNPAASLRADALHAALVPVPADLKDWARSLADRAFASVQNASDVHAIAYDEARGALSIVGATADKVKRAKILTELQLRHEGDIARLHARKAQTAAALEAARQKIDTQVCFGAVMRSITALTNIQVPNKKTKEYQQMFFLFNLEEVCEDCVSISVFFYGLLSTLV